MNLLHIPDQCAITCKCNDNVGCGRHIHVSFLLYAFCERGKFFKNLIGLTKKKLILEIKMSSIVCNCKEDKAKSVFSEETVIFWRLLKVAQKVAAACL